MLDKLRADRKVQPFAPGQQQALAQQMAWGFGGNPAQWIARMDKIYSPYTLPGGGRVLRSDDTGMKPADPKQQDTKGGKKTKPTVYLPYNFGYDYGH